MNTITATTCPSVGPYWRWTGQWKRVTLVVAGFVMASASGGYAYADRNYQEAIEMTPEIEEQMEYQKVPEFLADTMFKRIPNADEIVRNMNGEGLDSNELSYLMDPTDKNLNEFGSSRILDLLKLSEWVIQLPEYWVLLKLGSMDRDESDYWYWNGGSTYSRIFGNLSDEIEDEGVKHLATALQNNMWGNSMLTKDKGKHEAEREKHLLKALYIGATGSDSGVEPIVNGQYQQLPEVKELVREWEEEHDYSPFDEYGDNALLAYLANTITDKAPRSPHLAGLTLFVLVDYWHEEREAKSDVYSRTYNSIKKTPEYRYMNDNKIHLPFEMFD